LFALEGLWELPAPTVPGSSHAELFALPTSRTYARSRPRGGGKARYPQLRGRLADEAAWRYLAGALGDGCWHELEGLWIIGRAQGISRRAFEQTLAELALEWTRRGFLEERFVRIVSDADEAAVLDELDELVEAGEAVRLNGGRR
jgi:hypothetical protein